MPKYIKTDKEQDNLFMTIKLSSQIIPGTLPHTLQFLIDQRIDIKPFEDKIKNDHTGRPAHHPGILLKLILFAYSQGINTSRKIQRLATENLTAVALCENTAPDFTVIADFITGMKNEIKAVFVQILLTAYELDLLGNTVFALDGCKLPSNAAKENSGTFSDLKNKQKKIEEVIQYLLDTHDQNPEDDNFQKKINKLRSKADKIEHFLKTTQKKEGKRSRENQSNMTDNESAKMKTGHGTIQGYNGQVIADDKHQIIIAADAFGQGPENDLFEPMIQLANQNMEQVTGEDQYLADKTVLSDTGYFSESNLQVADENKINAYIPDQYFRKRDPRFKDKDRHDPSKKGKIMRDDFTYDPDKDEVICPAGNRLVLSKGKPIKTNKIIYKKYIGKKSFCSACPKRDKCLRSKKTNYRIYQISMDHEGKKYSRKMMDKIDTVEGRDIYSRRMGIVEPVFANIRIHKRLNRFTLRTQAKVSIQWMLYCIVHNIEKIFRYGDLNLLHMA